MPRRDLRVERFPTLTEEEWRDRQAVLDLLFRRAEARATDAVEWYLEDKRRRRRVSRALRASAIMLASAGALVPLGSGLVDLRLGYLLLGAAGTMVGFDRFFGISSGWMRDIASSQEIQRNLQTLYDDWASYSINASETDESHILEKLRIFSDKISSTLSSETSTWQNEFSATLTQLESLVKADSSRANPAKGGMRPV